MRKLELRFYRTNANLLSIDVNSKLIFIEHDRSLISTCLHHSNTPPHLALRVLLGPRLC